MVRVDKTRNRLNCSVAALSRGRCGQGAVLTGSLQGSTVNQ